MAVIISLLRGVNVVGHNKVKMEALRALYESLRLRDAQTYIQSGNVVFRTKETDLDKLARKIENGIEKKFSFRPAVILRTTSELRDVIARNPFANRRDIHPGKFLVTFLAGHPDTDACAKVLKMKIEPEELRIVGREVYIYFLNGQGRSKLSWVMVERTLRVSGTGRNWNTVNKLLEIAEMLEVAEKSGAET
jgi:uncharacterized protein (DUF1697 family)